MSNTFQGNRPPGSNDDKKPSFGGLGQPASGQSQTPGQTGRLNSGQSQVGSPFSHASGLGQTERKPLFPPRDNTLPGQSKAGEYKPLFPPRDAQGKTEERKPLFPPRDVQTGAGEYKSLFPRKDEAAGAGLGKTEFKSMFPPKTDQTVSSFGHGVVQNPSITTQTNTPKPRFGANPLDNTKLQTIYTPAAAGTGVSASRTIEVTDAEFIQLRDFLYAQSGIFIAETRKYLVENRLASRLRELGLRNFGEYYNFLRFDSSRTDELNKLFEYMTTNETSFFRNQPQLDVFRDKALRKVLDEQRAKGQKKLRIWSAGCSSGEEPYTLAMILHEVLKGEIDSWDIKITANDLSLAMLAAARRGMYNDYAIRATPPEMLNKYFTKEGNLYRIDPKLARLISFGQINLSDKIQLQRVERSQIVFCRNVIIYFDDEMKRSVIGAFYDNLLAGGYLIIGHSESLHNISRAFKPEHYAGSIIYLKQS